MTDCPSPRSTSSRDLAMRRNTLTLDDYGAFETAWCPGCGNFGILKALKQALMAAGLAPHQVLFGSGIGQAAKAPHYLKANVFNGLHGRSLPVEAIEHVRLQVMGSLGRLPDPRDKQHLVRSKAGGHQRLFQGLEYSEVSATRAPGRLERTIVIERQRVSTHG